MSSLATEPAPAEDLRRSLSLVDAISIIVGIVIGVGIFKAPAIVAGNVGGIGAFFGVWIAGGVISLLGALCYAELGSAWPNAGGEYFFLRSAFGETLAFLFGWARMTVIQTGAIAAIAFVFGDYATELWPLGPRSSAIYAGLAVLAVTALNIRGTSESKGVQKVLTAGLGVAIVAIIAAGLTNREETAAPIAAAGTASFSGLAMIFVLLTYGGWNEAAYLTAEMRDSRRGIVRALVLGILIITTVYLLLNAAYVSVLGLEGVRASSAVAADAMRLSMGPTSAAIIGLIVVAASLSTLNASVFTGARTNYALGRDFTAFRFLGRWNARPGTPVNALIVQAAIVLVLVALGSLTHDGFTTMVAYTAPAFWLFLLLTGLSLFVLRRREPMSPEPFRVPLYPVTPIVFCAACLYMLYASVSYAMSLKIDSLGAIVGIGVLFAGVPALFLVRRRP